MQAERSYLLASKAVRKFDSIVAFGLFALGLVYSLYYETTIFSLLAMIIAPIFLFIGFYLYFIVPNRIFKQTDKFKDEYTLAFSEKNILFSTKNIESTLKWGNYVKAWESSDFYFLIQTPRIHTIIPKRAFETAEQEEVFKAILSQKFKGTKKI